MKESNKIITLISNQSLVYFYAFGAVSAVKAAAPQAVAAAAAPQAAAKAAARGVQTTFHFDVFAC
jgi:hypothetical protein